jgi:hypothetical protein
MAVSLLGSVLAAAGCSDDGDLAPNESPMTLAEAAGNGQAGEAGEQLGDPLQVTVTRDDEPVADAEVEWLTSGGGSFSPDTSLTDEFGVAQTLWTLGSAEGEQLATARLIGSDAEEVRFTAEAVQAAPPPPGGPQPPAAVRRPRH